MKLTIIPADSAVYKDGIAYLGLSWAGTPNDIHALQWLDNKGWIEYAENDTKLIWHVNENSLSMQNWYGPNGDYPVFEICVGMNPVDSKIKSVDGDILSQKIISVKIKF